MEANEQSLIRTIYNWVTLILILFIVDDGVFGPIFWGISQINLLFSVVAAFAGSWTLSYWLTLQGMDEKPGRVARYLLRNLRLERKSVESERDRTVQRLREKTTSIGIAIPMTMLFGGVIVTLWLLRRGAITPERARHLAFWLTGLYAAEFAFVHAFGIGGSIFFVRQ